MQTKTTRIGFGILVIDRGNVIVGEFEMSDDDEMITVRDGRVIRRWGTTNGLGQLAAGGPTEKTVLNPLNRTAHVRKSAMFFIIECDPEQWS